MKLLQNIARVFVDQLEQRLEYEIKEVFAPPAKRKPRLPNGPKKPKRMKQIEQQIAPGVTYIPPPKGNKT